MVVALLEPIQQRYQDIRSSGMLSDILAQGAESARVSAARTLEGVKERMGFLPTR